MSDLADREGGVHEEHFESLAQQAHAARLGMWVFLASEVLLFAALFALYASYRMEFGIGFREAVHENAKILGSVNTGVLLLSSTLVACSVHALRAGKTKLSAWLLVGTMSLGGVFLAIKATEYRRHFHEGIYPGGAGQFFVEHPVRGLPEFWTLYFGMTGLHAVHVIVGISVLGAMLLGVLRGHVNVATAYRLELGAIYWHLVDPRVDLPLAAVLHRMTNHPATAGVSLRAVLLTGVVVLVLWALSFALSFVALGSAAMPVALVIAAIKAGLVALVFMELAREALSIKLTLVTAVVLALTLGAFMLADIATRDLP